MKIAVLGTDGFIGSALSEFFRARGADVVGVSVRNSDCKDYAKAFIQGLDQAQNSHPDVLINATGAADVQSSFSDPLKDYVLNVHNTRLMLERAVQSESNTRYIHLSSAAVYGMPTRLPVQERDANSSRPLSPYGWHKLLAERMVYSYSKNCKIKALNLRIFSCFGPGQRKLLLWDIYQKLKQSGGKTLSLYGTGRESRDYIHVRDLCRAVENTIEQADFAGEAINVASGREVPIAHVAELAVEAISPGAEIVFTGEEKPGDPMRWHADISLLASFGFSPAVEFEEGIKAYYDWLLNNET